MEVQEVWAEIEQTSDVDADDEKEVDKKSEAEKDELVIDESVDQKIVDGWNDW